MLELTGHIRIWEDELSWQFSRSGGPGGQNVNKVASKAMLRWNVTASASVPTEVKSRLRALYRGRFTTEGILVLASQRFRDQERNRQDCLEKLREMVRHAATPPRARKPSRPTRGSKERRLHAKKRRAAAKSSRRPPEHD
jgi:ribosome-associated protein